jgi:hypothetical protein
MKYADLREEIRSGDLLAWSARRVENFHDLKVQAIRVFDRTEYTHVGIAWRSGGRVWVIESVKPRVRVVPLSNLLPCYRVALKRPWNLAAEEYALSFVGNEAFEYSEWEAIKGFFGASNKNDHWLECAEFVKMVYERLGVELPGRATPSDTVNDMLSLGGELTLLEK